MMRSPVETLGLIFHRDGVPRETHLRSWFGQSVPLHRVIDSLSELAEILGASLRPVYLVESGTWLPQTMPLIPPSASGKPLLAFGKRLSFGGELPKSLYMERETAREIARFLRSGASFEAAIKHVSQDKRLRTIHVPGLNYGYDENLRILHLITSLQTGGAERLVVELSRSSMNQHFVCIATMSDARRKGFKASCPVLDLAPWAHDPVQLAAQLKRIVQGLGIDLVHAHLLSGSRLAALSQAEIPLVLTLHNMPASWPSGLEDQLHKSPPSLLIACCKRVAQAARKRVPRTALRTAWNGIDPAPFNPTPEKLNRALEWRKQQGWGDDLIAIAVANPRKQKNLGRIPAVLAQVRSIDANIKRVRLILVGEAMDAESQKWLDHLRKRCLRLEIALSEFGDTDPSLYLHASDVFVSTSRFEGLSLAQLEALAAGLPVIATDVGAAQEIRAEMGESPFYVPVHRSRSNTAFASEIVSSYRHAKSQPRISRLPPPFCIGQATLRNRQLYHAALTTRSSGNKPHRGIWLITNNFLMGGAQSSARRLLEGLDKLHVPVQAFTVHEPVPSPGTQDLRERGIAVTAIAPYPQGDSKRAALILMDRAIQQPPKAMLFWNLMPGYKVMIADALANIARIIDVSPGEMYFKELGRYFEKPLTEVPYRSAAEYCALLHCAVVKFSAEAREARKTLKCAVQVIRNGVPLLRMHESPRPEKHDKVIFGTAARIAPDKRIEDLLESYRLAYQHIPRSELLIAGRIERGFEDYAAQLRKSVLDLPVTWLGELPNTHNFLARLHIFVMISEPAGCPNASLEALAAGVPTIATDVGGASEQIIHGRTGLLVPRRDNAAFSKAMIRLARSKKLREKFQVAGPIHISRKFSVDEMIAKYKKLCL